MLNIAPSDQPRKVSPEVEAQLAALEAAKPGEGVPFSQEAFEELARRELARRNIVITSAPKPEWRTVAEAVLIVTVLVVFIFLIVWLIATTAVQP